MNKGLHDLYQLIEQGRVVKDITVRGKVFTMRSLQEADYVWRDQFLNISSPAAWSASTRAPTLAVAMVAIDGQPVADDDTLKTLAADVPAAVKEYITANSTYLVAYNLYEKVLSKMPHDYVVELYNAYNAEVLTPAEKVTAEQLKNS